MKRKILGILVLILVLLVGSVQAAELTLRWIGQTDAVGFRVYRSADMGVNWTMLQEVGNVTEIVLTGQPDTGIVLYRVGAVNAVGETVRFTAGAWNWADAPRPPAQPAGTGID